MAESDGISVHNKLLLMRTREAADFDVETLIAWTRDADEEVRDWATFTLGAQSDLDSEEVRQALLARVDDPHFDTRCEALVGLARRQDKRGVQALVDAMQGDVVGELMVQAMGYYGSPVFIPLLEEMEGDAAYEGWYVPEALARCRGTMTCMRFWDLVGSNDNMRERRGQGDA